MVAIALLDPVATKQSRHMITIETIASLSYAIMVAALYLELRRAETGVAPEGLDRIFG